MTHGRRSVVSLQCSSQYTNVPWPVKYICKIHGIRYRYAMIWHGLQMWYKMNHQGDSKFSHLTSDLKALPRWSETQWIAANRRCPKEWWSSPIRSWKNTVGSDPPSSTGFFFSQAAGCCPWLTKATACSFLGWDEWKYQSTWPSQSHQLI